MPRYFSNDVFRYYLAAVGIALILYFASADYFYLFCISLVGSSFFFWAYTLVDRFFIRRRPTNPLGRTAKYTMLASVVVLAFAGIYSLGVAMNFDNAVFFLSTSLLILLAYVTMEND